MPRPQKSGRLNIGHGTQRRHRNIFDNLIFCCVVVVAVVVFVVGFVVAVADGGRGSCGILTDVFLSRPMCLQRLRSLDTKVSSTT